MTDKSKHTSARPRKETVAEPKGAAGESQTVAEETADVVAEPAASVESQSAQPQHDVAVDKGFCDNHPDVPAVLVTDFPWTPAQRFCLPCVPDQYRYLL